MKVWLNVSLTLTVALLATHELDAMTHAEWRLLPVLSALEDETAREIFVLLHIPLFAGILAAIYLAPWKRRAAVILCTLTIIHAIAHWLLSGSPLYTFTAPIETITVYGGALSSAVYLGLSFLETSE